MLLALLALLVGRLSDRLRAELTMLLVELLRSTVRLVERPARGMEWAGERGKMCWLLAATS